ncbi:hypothetical protein [Neosynechococcus sphagnicola]|uniref:hypothetical protein n=1 Tax=Neosynechococcus sphagnicola TaxID=1501145 RepID=UPI001872CB76|nr:hypothetical protein [Neosynechococcus sphagnicola]
MQEILVALTGFLIMLKRQLFLKMIVSQSRHFFAYCDELLERYRKDSRIMIVSGDNFDFGVKSTIYSYYFSRYSQTWGWASWARTWKLVDPSMNLWPEFRNARGLESMLTTPAEIKYWDFIFQGMYSGDFNKGWDYLLQLSSFMNHGLSIIPSVNLISNIGFDHDATHTTDNTHCLANLDTFPINFPLHHPPYIFRHAQSDKDVQKNVFGDQGEETDKSEGLMSRLGRRLNSSIRRLTAH